MSSPRASNRRSSDAGHMNKTDSDKKKHVSKHSGTKNGTHGKAEIRRRASVAEHPKSDSKSDTKKHTSVDPHTRNTHTTGSTHNSSITKSHGTTAKHGKTVGHSGSDSPGKAASHSPAKKSDGHKPRPTKKSESDNKSDSKQDDHKDTNEEVTTAVSHDAEKTADKKSDNHNENLS